MASQITFSLSNLDASEARPTTDRFIHSRTSMEDLAGCFKLSPRRNSSTSLDSVKDENKVYSTILKNNFLQRRAKPPKTCLDFSRQQEINVEVPKKFQDNSNRKISKIPFKVLDAPFLQDDYYLNVVDWSKSDTLAVGLGNAAYLWSFKTNTVEKLTQYENYNLLTSLSWENSTNMLGIGTFSGRVQIWDVVKHKCVQEYEQHHERVGSLSIFDNLLLTGSRDRQILLNDMRIPSGMVMRFPEHKQEVCGLKWSFDGNYFASGGNDNKLFVFSPKTTFPIMKKTHKAAVKAIAWSPNRYGYLATGAGTADRGLRIWDINNKKLIDHRDTGSQICNVTFSKINDEIVSTHGFSNNEICIWKTRGLKKVQTLSGHTSRVLYLAMSPNGDIIVTGAGDETLRFWNLTSGPIQETEVKNRNSFINNFPVIR